MTEKSTILKLRQAESRDVTTNGSYSISLKEGVQLEEGDIVKVHSVFLDTTTESLVEIDEDTTITMEVAKYWRQWHTPIASPNQRWNANPTHVNAAVGPPVVPQVGQAQPDNKKYWVCSSFPSGANDYLIASVHIKPSKGGKEYGNFLLTYEYPAVGTKQIVKGQKLIPQYHTRSHASGVTIPINIMMDAGANPPSGQVVCTNKNLGSSNINVAPIGATNWAFTGPHGAGQSIANLYTEELSFILPRGRYMPEEVAKIISDQMSTINVNGPVGNNMQTADPKQWLVNNPFLSTGKQLSDKITKIPDQVGGFASFIMIPEVSQEFPVVPNIIEQVIVFDGSGDDYLMGASQTSMNYDETLKKLNFDLLHMPMLVNEGGDGVTFLPGVVWGQATTGGGGQPAGPVNRIAPMGTNGGVAFTRLEPVSFWETLGFTNILLPWEHVTTQLDLNGGLGILPINITSTDGLNTTSAFLGLDLVVEKTPAWYFTADGNPASKSTAYTHPIISNREFDNVSNDEGYLLVEIGVKIPQQMIGGNTEGATGSNRVQSIVGRYFQQQGNFLQDNGAGSIVYEHVGLPQMITDLDVRVVHPDGAPPNPNELGVSNSVFLEIVKTAQTTQPTQK